MCVCVHVPVCICGSMSLCVFERCLCVCVSASESLVSVRTFAWAHKSVQCMCVRLAFQLKAHTEATEALHRSQHATPQCAEQETQRCGDATYIVPTTLDV